MRKSHPCKGKFFLVLRSGMDFKLRCTTCEHEFMVKRSKIEKNIKKITRQKLDDQRGDLILFDKLEVFKKRNDEINQMLYDPNIVSYQEKYKALMKEQKI